jgi:cell cycle sensor histidine kinase DivJ
MTTRPQRFIWAEIDLSMLPGSTVAGEICALVRDISAVKQRASELTLAREKAEASDAAKGRFLATMSHELRTPLNAIIGFADILDEEVFGALGNDQQREYVGLIRESGGHLLQLVNDLLDMSKLDAGHFQIVAEPFSLATVVDRCTRLVSQQIEKAGLTLTIDVPDTLPELVADQRAVRQVLINLLSNAYKFTPQGGTITLRARKDAGNLVLSVIDNGIGIAAKDLGKIGQPFFQANNAYDRDHQGTGLGLSVVKGLCELHTGSLSISSVEGEGTTVTVRIPFNGPKTSENGQTDTDVANTVVLAKLQRERAAANPEPQRAGNMMPDAGSPQQDLFEEEGQRAHG